MPTYSQALCLGKNKPVSAKIKGEAGADPRMVRIGTGPPFWQINHANSAYFRLFLGYFGVISANWPPLFTYPGSSPGKVPLNLPLNLKSEELEQVVVKCVVVHKCFPQCSAGVGLIYWCLILNMNINWMLFFLFLFFHIFCCCGHWFCT